MRLPRIALPILLILLVANVSLGQMHSSGTKGTVVMIGFGAFAR